MRIAAAVLALTWLAVATALASPLPAAAPPPGWTGDGRLSVRLVAAAVGTDRAGQAETGIAFRIAPGWYTYWRAPGDAGIPPQIDWSASENLRTAEIGWPAPRLHRTGGLRGNVYDHDVVLPVSIQATRPGEPVRLRALLRYAGCADICVPYEAELALDLAAGDATPTPDAASLAEARRLVPGPLAASGWREALVRDDRRDGGRGLVSVLIRSGAGRFEAPDLFVDAGLGRTAAATVQPAEGGASVWLRISVADEPGTPPGPLSLTLVDGARAASWSVPARR